MGKTERDPSEILTDFLNYIDCCRASYQAAQDAVRKEERRLQDLLHELEFAGNENEKRRAATKLQQSRRERRKQKDEMMRRELVVDFFAEQTHKGTLNKMRQLLGRQRKQEEFLDGGRHYNPRVKE